MRSVAMIATLMMLLAVSVCVMPRNSAIPAGEAGLRANVDERFAVRYCYRQYRNQTDITDCLTRTANLSRRAY
jgi:hypothetical protein